MLLGFGDGFVSNDKEFELLAQVFMVGQGENVMDMYLSQPKKKAVARLYLGAKDKDAPVLFALFNTHGVPRYLANEVVESVSNPKKITYYRRHLSSFLNCTDLSDRHDMIDFIGLGVILH